MKTRRFDFDYKPLILTKGSADDNVPDVQNYNAETGEYTPDYTLTPLVMQPRVGVVDRDGVVSPGCINAQLYNIEWKEVVGGVSRTITASDPDYTLALSGEQAGQITMRKNVTPQNPVTLMFSAQYTDSRTGQIFHVNDSRLIKCENATVAHPRVVLDAADQTIYNPLKDPDTQVVHARLMLGSGECPAAKRIFVWEEWDDTDDMWKALSDDEVMNYHLSVSGDGASCTVNRRLMGRECAVRCRAKYDAGGNPSGVALNGSSPCKSVSFVRRIPKFDYDIAGVPYNIPTNIREIKPSAVIVDALGTISNPERELAVLWSIATNNGTGTLTYKQVAVGQTAVISTSPLDPLHGAVVGLEVKDRGPVGAFEDGDGKVFVDNTDGKIILIH